MAILITAAKNGTENIIGELIQHGADVNDKNKDGNLFPSYLSVTFFLFIIHIQVSRFKFLHIFFLD